MPKRKHPRRPALHLAFHEVDGAISAKLHLDGQLRLDFVHESPPAVRVVGYPKHLRPDDAIRDLLRRMAPDGIVEAVRMLDEVVGVTERQLAQKMTDLRSEIRKLALLSARSEAAKRLREVVRSDQSSKTPCP